MDLLNSVEGLSAGGAAAAAQPPGTAPAAGLGGGPAAALQQMQSKLEALRIRKQRITGEWPVSWLVTWLAGRQAQASGHGAAACAAVPIWVTSMPA